MKATLNKVITTFFKQTYDTDVGVEWSVPEAKFGDLATNVALIQARQAGKNPREIAEQLVTAIENTGVNGVDSVEVAGPGFINVRLSSDYYSGLSKEDLSIPQSYGGKKVVTEFSDPNPFKPLHVGHLYTSIVGDAISRMVAAAGGDVSRVNFGGDVGLHVAKSMWGIKQSLNGFNVNALKHIPDQDRANWLGDRYVEGSAAYNDDETAKAEIQALNKEVYEIHSSNDTDSDTAQIYWEAREWSYKYFENFYNRIDVEFDEFIPESTNAQVGLETVKSHMEDGVYEEDDGAIIFRGDDYDLHNRVFINADGLPTYEAKDVGLAKYKWDTYAFDESIIITGNDIIEYMKVVKKSMETYLPEAVERTLHLTHGQVVIKGSGKMSSREGNVLLAEAVLDATNELIETQDDSIREKIMLAAIRYSFLKQRLGDNIQFNMTESVRTVGNSGPYLQYALVRAKSVLRHDSSPSSEAQSNLEEDERLMLREISQAIEVIDRATTQHAPHLLCTYMYDLAQQFNRFYENNQVIGSDREPIRVHIVELYVFVLEQSFNVLGIPVLEEM